MPTHNDKLKPVRSEEERNEIVMANIAFLHWYVRRLRITNDLIEHMDYDDAVAYGAVGMIRAADLFRDELKISFRTYAGWWIRKAIQEALPGELLVRLPLAEFDRTSTMNWRGKIRVVSPTDCEDSNHHGGKQEQDWWCPFSQRISDIVDDRMTCRKLLSGLPRERRRVIAMHLRGFNGEEIARKIGRNRTTVNAWIKAAIREMKMAASQMKVG